MKKPQVGISSVWYEGNTCNMHLMQLAEAVREGVWDAGMVGFRFNTIGVSDAISMGTRGMCYSLQSRDLIADSIETVMAAQWYDGNISIPGCDKNMPGTIMAMGRLNRPSIMVYGGTIKPGHFQDHSYDIVSAFQCYGEYVSGKITDDQRMNVVRNSCPGAGACGGMYTANTMASAIEAMGMSLPYSSSTPAEDPLKLDECRLVGKYLLNLMEMDLKPRDIITERSIKNAMVMVMALGGSTNAVLHLIAIARSVGLNLTLDDFQKISDKVPFLADLKPSGKYVMEDVHKIGGTPAVIRFLLEEGFLDGDCMTVTGKSLAENAKLCPGLSVGQQIIRPLSNPIKSTGHIQILYGNLAPEGSVAKITGKEGLYFSGPALVFDGEESMIAAISENPMNFKNYFQLPIVHNFIFTYFPYYYRAKVVVIRGEGPKGGPGMPEMLTPTSDNGSWSWEGIIVFYECALLTDGRFSGGSHGYVVGHICPEAQEGGPIGLVKNGDEITIDIQKRRMDVKLTDEQLAERRRKWTPPAYKASRGVLYKYIKNVKSASSGKYVCFILLANILAVVNLNRCYEQDVGIDQILFKEINPLLDGVLRGSNACVLGYGARGSGKTYNSVNQDHTYDVLKLKEQEVLVLEDAGRKIQLTGLSQVPVTLVSDFERMYFHGLNQHKGPQKSVTDAQLRSHSGLIVYVAAVDKDTNTSHPGKINFIDLAGYADAKHISNPKPHLSETAKVNKSLFQLLNVVYALNVNETYVPYRESKLTRLMQDFICKTSGAVLATCLNPVLCQDTTHVVAMGSRSCRGGESISI
ncbi:hypothetical protein J5N97_026175 [Dioscorea zingiberensis]|uniref:Kinesin motor domain-containing protein n=1 Tax=Dioscorea zingiberensis TaxID=325984 RepID=A0A9D5C2P6_9LILI|nr:hypothetical protein J5N97_026175 [Dioscorea zingiberensis]